MRFHIFLCIVFLAACGPSPDSVPAASSRPSTPTALHFQFSQAPRTVTYEGEPNPCHQKFSEALAFFPDPANSKRRYFALGEGLHKVAVQEKGTVAFFWIQRKGDLTVEVLTSDQLPQCLSNRAHFTLDASGGRFRFNNGQFLDFDVSAEQAGGVLRIWLEMPLDKAYGMSAWRKGGAG
jgi:hypothetical protein